MTPTTPELADKYLMHTAKRVPVTFVRGRGCVVYDDAGREYLDLVAGIAVNVLGHAHPEVAAAVASQAHALIHASNLYFTRPQVELAQRLVELSFPARVFFGNSGAEANEGRTMATIAAGGQPKYSDPFKPLPDGFVHVPFNDLEAIKAATNEKTVAVMLEPVMGEIGVIPSAPGYLEGVRKWCDEKGLLMILDEVQTGIGRTGRWFAHQHDGITPDVMTLAKGLGGGVPIGAVLAAPRADVFEPGDHGSTFGGNPLACAAALAVLHVVERDGLVGHAAEMGDLLDGALRDLGGQDVRGRGLMRAVQFAEPKAKPFQQACLEAGVLVNAVDDHTVRFVPPLIISPDQIEHAHSTMQGLAQ
ncbi:MAG: aminotransferase class III-fold pyridoxal phosphate-dependent enzyme [Chloroflexi bacterium]|nr:MAG: aminotransferase class III-fold pyridoxal phosphate-dependent enzyme [Chloroflexota bacterium]